VSKLPDKFLARLRSGEDPDVVVAEFIDSEGIEDPWNNLGHLCRVGYPDPDDDPEASVDSAVLVGGRCSVQLQVYFSEVTNPGGCADLPNRKPRDGKVHFTIDIQSGEVIWGVVKPTAPLVSDTSLWE